jgi:hypothetical protein
MHAERLLLPRAGQCVSAAAPVFQAARWLNGHTRSAYASRPRGGSRQGGGAGLRARASGWRRRTLAPSPSSSSPRHQRRRCRTSGTLARPHLLPLGSTTRCYWGVVPTVASSAPHHHRLATPVARLLIQAAAAARPQTQVVKRNSPSSSVGARNVQSEAILVYEIKHCTSLVLMKYALQ